MSQNSRCEPIAQFPFFEISDFEYVQLKSSNKFTVTLYRHIETNIYYIIKEVSFDHKRIGIYQVLFRIRSPNIVPAFGLSLMRYRIGKVDSPQRSTGK